MDIAISLVALAAVVITVSGLSGRWDLPTPLVLIAFGVVVSYVPLVPQVHLSSEVVLVGLLPPLLYSAALQSSLVDFNANRGSILLLSVGLVAFTAVGVGLVAHQFLPGTNWPAAFAIGAVVAPPDAVAASAIGRRIGLPRRIVTVLEGESLLNDATALVALRTAIAAGTVGGFSVARTTLDFVVAAGVGLVVGLVTFLVIGRVRKQLTEPVLDSGVSFVTPFAAYVLAEELHGSGVLAVVVAGLLLGHKAPVLQTASSRITERLNWRTISFLLENTVFLLIGLQARWIIGDSTGSGMSVGQIVGICALTLLTTIVLRLLWVMPSGWLIVRPPDRFTGRESTWRDTAIVGWAGMRGVVTLAAAFAIPASFPHRDVLVLVALSVTAGTLFLQGLSLAWLARRLEYPLPIRARTRWPVPPCSRKPPSPGWPSSRSTPTTRTPMTRWRRCVGGPSSVTSRPGSGSATTTRRRRRRARPTRGCGWRCCRPSARRCSTCGPPDTFRRTWSRTCWRRWTSRSPCWTSVSGDVGG